MSEGWDREPTSVVLVKMATGGYLDREPAHESINLFKTDEDSTYPEHAEFPYCLYAPAGGCIGSKIGDYPVGDDPWVLLVTKDESGYLVVGKARGIKRLAADESTALGNDVTYGDIELSKLTAGSDGHKTLVGMLAREVVLPKPGVEIRLLPDGSKKDGEEPLPPGLHPESAVASEDGKSRGVVGATLQLATMNAQQLGRSQRYAFPAEQGEGNKRASDFPFLVGLLRMSDLWGDPADRVTGQESSADVREPSFGFLDLCGKENDELAFSNALAYYLANYDKVRESLLGTLWPECSGDLVVPTVEREKHRIDLLLASGDKRLIIENKIHAPLAPRNKPSEKSEFTSTMPGTEEIQTDRYFGKVLMGLYRDECERRYDDEEAESAVCAKEAADALKKRAREDVGVVILCPNYHEAARAAGVGSEALGGAAAGRLGKLKEQALEMAPKAPKRKRGEEPPKVDSIEVSYTPWVMTYGLLAHLLSQESCLASLGENDMHPRRDGPGDDLRLYEQLIDAVKAHATDTNPRVRKDIVAAFLQKIARESKPVGSKSQ